MEEVKAFRPQNTAKDGRIVLLENRLLKWSVLTHHCHGTKDESMFICLGSDDDEEPSEQQVASFLSAEETEV